MQARIGADIEQISRVQQAMTRTPRFVTRLFTSAEQAYCESKARPAQHYAARFCAKEALAKALGMSLSWLEVEVGHHENGQPCIYTHGAAAAALAGRDVQLSLSHAGDYAMAVVLVE